jgi:hypothetical protein
MTKDTKLTITTIGGRQVEIETPLDILVDDFIRELCAVLKLPTTDAEDHIINWRLDDNTTGRTLDGAISLAAAGVREGHSLFLSRPTTAGGFAIAAETLLTDERKTQVSVSMITRFLWWCSGAQTTILEGLPTEHTKYLAMGFAVLADGVFAALSGVYACYLVSNNQIVGMLGGCVWGFIVFNLTRFTLSSMTIPVREEPARLPSILRRLFPALPRLVLAVVIGFIVSTPLVIRIFRNEIYDSVYSVRRNKEDELVRQIARSEASAAAIQKRIDEKQQEVDRLRNLLGQELQGSGPTKVLGAGPVYRELLDQLNRAQKELSDVRNETREQLEKDYLYTSEKKAEEKILASEVEGTPSFLTQIQTLSELSKSNPAIATTRWLMTLMLILLYSNPLLFKLLSSPGPYDVLLARDELGFAEKESLAIQKAFTEVLDKSNLNPRNKEALWRDVPK